MELDAFGFERFLKRHGNVVVFPRQKLTAAMNDHHPAAKATKHQSEFKADVATAEDDQMFGNFLQLHHRLIREIADRVDSRNTRRIGTRSRIDKDFIALENLVADLHLPRREKARHTAVETQLRMLVNAALLATAKTLHHCIFARHDRTKIDADPG